MGMDRSRRAVIASLLAGAAMFVAPAASAAEAVTVGTVGQASGNLWPVFIGLNKGFFAAEDLKVDVVHVQSSAPAGAADHRRLARHLHVDGLVDPMRAIDGRRSRTCASRAGAALASSRKRHQSLKELKGAR
jgi:hypothetical protein